MSRYDRGEWAIFRKTSVAEPLALNLFSPVFPVAMLLPLYVAGSSQDMISFAGGLALAGMTAVVHTYSNFLKRDLENIFINLTERTKIVYMVGKSA